MCGQVNDTNKSECVNVMRFMDVSLRENDVSLMASICPGSLTNPCTQNPKLNALISGDFLQLWLLNWFVSVDPSK